MYHEQFISRGRGGAGDYGGQLSSCFACTSPYLWVLAYRVLMDTRRYTRLTASLPSIETETLTQMLFECCTGVADGWSPLEQY